MIYTSRSMQSTPYMQPTPSMHHRATPPIIPPAAPAGRCLRSMHHRAPPTYLPPLPQPCIAVRSSLSPRAQSLDKKVCCWYTAHHEMAWSDAGEYVGHGCGSGLHLHQHTDALFHGSAITKEGKPHLTPLPRERSTTLGTVSVVDLEADLGHGWP